MWMSLCGLREIMCMHACTYFMRWVISWIINWFACMNIGSMHVRTHLTMLNNYLA